MDRVFSARLDDSIVNQIKLLAKQLDTTNKEIIEQAIRLFTSQVKDKEKVDIIRQTHGIWHEDETADETVQRIRKEVNDSFTRYWK